MSSPPNFLPLTGPTFIGHLFNWGLYGVLTVQVYLYYISFPKDNYKLKTVVASAYILDTIQLTLATYDGFRIYGSGWGDAKQLDTMSLQWVSLPVLGGLVGALYQIFYAWRIYALGQNRWLACIILLISMVVIGSGIYEGAACARLLLMSEAPRRTYKPTIAWIGCAALGEAIITGSMFYYLHKARRSSRVKQTTNLLTRLIALTIETGLISATVDVTGLALFIALPDAAYYEPLAIVASKLLSNCLIAVLNSRIHIAGGRNASEMDVVVNEGIILELSQPPPDLTRSLCVDVGIRFSDENKQERRTPGYRAYTCTETGTVSFMNSALV